MKKIISIFVSILLVVGIFSVVPASATTYTEIDCSKLTKIADLDQKVNDGTAVGISVKDMAVNSVSNVYKITVPENSYLVIQYGGIAANPSTIYNNLSANLFIYSDINLTKLVLNKELDKYGSASFNSLDSINKGTYYVQFTRNDSNFSSEKASLFAYFGYLPSNTELFSVDFVKSENNGKNISLKINTLDEMASVKAGLANGPRELSTISCDEVYPDENGVISFGLNQGSAGYSECYCTIYVEDVYGNSFSKWYGIMTDYTTTVNGIPSAVEYTGKPITLKDLKVITGYKHNNCATYDVKYENNTDVGTAKVTITGNGNFIGSVTKTFKIVHTKHNDVTKVTKKPTYFNKGKKTTTCSVCGKISSVSIPKLTLKVPSFTVKGGSKYLKVTYKKATGAKGYQVKYVLGKKTVVKTYKSAKAATRKINKLKKGKYKIQVRSMIVAGNLKAYSNWSKAKTVKVK